MPSLVCFYGLDLLWAFIQDDRKSSVSVEVVELAIDHIIALLGFVDGKEPEWALQPSLLHNAGACDSSGRSRLPPPESAQQAASVTLKHQLVSRCVENLETNSSSPQSLHVMQVRRVRACACHHRGVCAVVPCWLWHAVVTVRACVYVCACTQRVLSTFPQNPRSGGSRDKNYVGAVLESLQNKSIKDQRLLDIYVNNLQVRCSASSAWSAVPR